MDSGEWTMENGPWRMENGELGGFFFEAQIGSTLWRGIEGEKNKIVKEKKQLAFDFARSVLEV